MEEERRCRGWEGKEGGRDGPEGREGEVEREGKTGFYGEGRWEDGMKDWRKGEVVI